MYFWHCSGGSSDAIFWTPIYGSQKGLWYHGVIKPLYSAGRKLNDAKYWFKYRFVRAHQYHIVRTNLPPGYNDEDTRILHACFAMLESFVDWHGGVEKLEAFTEELKLARQSDEESFPGNAESSQIKLQTEAAALYRWWTVEKPANEAERNQLMTDWHENRDRPGTSERWERYAAANTKVDADEQSMLHRLIEIRPGLWT